MGEGLREVPEMGSRRRVHLFAIQAQGVGLVEQGLEQLDGFWAAASVGQGLDEPERARQECAFGAGQAVASWRVSLQQGTSSGQPISDGVDRVIHPGRAGVLDA